MRAQAFEPHMFGPVAQILANTGVIGSDPLKFRTFNRGVRDSDKVNVIECPDTGVLFVDRLIHQPKDQYRKRLPIQEAAKSPDNLRRAERVKPLIIGNNWVDVGAGSGGLLYKLHKFAGYAVGVERGRWREFYPCDCREDIEELEHDYYDVLTLFHVIEHIPDPLGFLSKLRMNMKEGGTIIIETPNSNDFLLRRCKNARTKLLWSEHVVLFSERALRKLVRDAGFKQITIEQIQRYPISNHLYWFAEGSPNGHEVWTEFNSIHLVKAYNNKLMDIGAADTLFLTAKK